MYSNNTYKDKKTFFFAKTNSVFCHWLIVWWIGWLKCDETKRIGNFTIDSLNKQEPRCCLEEAHTATTAWQPLLMLVTGLVTHCCGTASHSSTSTCRKSANVLVSVNCGASSTPRLIPPPRAARSGLSGQRAVCHVDRKAWLQICNTQPAAPECWHDEETVFFGDAHFEACLWHPPHTPLMELGLQFGDVARAHSKQCRSLVLWNSNLKLPHHTTDHCGATRFHRCCQSDAWLAAPVLCLVYNVHSQGLTTSDFLYAVKFVFEN